MAESDSTREYVERGIAIAAPFLDLVLAAGERISRITEPVDYEYYPVRDPDSGDRDEAAGKPGDPAAL